MKLYTLVWFLYKLNTNVSYQIYNFHIILQKWDRYLRYLQNEPIIAKQKLKIVKISQIIDMGFFGHRIQEQL